MILEKKLTIKEIFDEMKSIKARLINLATVYHRSTASITAVTWKDIVVGGGKKGDIMLNKVIKKEELENKFDADLASYNSYKELAIEEIREMISKESVEYCIAYFRDELKWRWEDIRKLFNYSLRQCHNLYNKHKNK
jgi:hypothetical protein|nr:MAG TPA: hypothetical protein [Caudoviricetes sp.]